MLPRVARFSWLIYAVIAGLMLLPGLFIGPSLDASVFSTVGWRLTEGDRLYADVWDHKPPAVFTPSLLAHALTATPEMAWVVTWAITVICIAATAYVIQRVLHGRGAGRAAYVAAGLAALVFGSYLLTLGGGLGESYAVLPAALAVAVVANRRGGLAAWLLSGLAAGAAAVISLQAVTVLAAIAVLGMFAAPRAVLARAAMVALGMVIVVVMSIVGLLVSGTLPEAAAALVRYTGAYRQAVSNSADSVPGGSFLLPWVFLSLLPLVLLGTMALLASRRDRTNRDIVLASAAWILAAVAAVVVQGRLYGHYALPLVVPLALAGGIGLDGMTALLTGRRGGTLLLAPIAFAAVLALAVGAAGAPMEQRWIRASNERTAAVAPAIRELSEAEDTIVVWGNEPRLYELSDRAPALRYPYLYPLLTRGYVTPGLVDELASQLRANPPAVFVDAGSEGPGEPGLPPLLIDRPVATDGRDYDILDPLRAFVAERYEERETVAGWVIYTLRPAS